ncbi:Dabb family protein [Pleomorphomonas oryzae]|uniref:Dabb family protein n=1 Tax=Pleomorphomonas oryzae TaxID=261934 RepID=UPI000400E36E|nr:Dabb family protein [Pleomorphomonas oryzae]
MGLDLATSKLLVHVVLISFRDGTPADIRRRFLEHHQSLGARCGGLAAGIVYWQVSENLDQRKAWHAVQFSLFRDRAALSRFSQHPEHIKAGEELREIADWVVGDLETIGAAGVRG